MSPKKVLIIGPKFHGYNQSVQQAFENLGFATCVFSYNDDQLENLKDKIAFNLTKNKVNLFLKKRIKTNAEIINIYNQFQPHLVFVIKGSCLLPKTIIELNKAITVLWAMDSISRIKNYKEFCSKIDYLFLFEQNDIVKIKKELKVDAHFLPQAFDEKIYYPIQSNKQIDIFFAGILYPNRIELLKKIVNKYAELNIKIYGTYYSAIRKPFYHLFRKDKTVFTNKMLKPSELNQLYAKSKICLNIHHQQSIESVNPRFFEILGTKSLQITDSKLFIKENFRDNEVISFNTEEELYRLIENTLNNYSEVEGIKENGYKKVIEKHTFTCRIKQVLETISQLHPNLAK